MACDVQGKEAAQQCAGRLAAGRGPSPLGACAGCVLDRLLVKAVEA